MYCVDCGKRLAKQDGAARCKECQKILNKNLQAIAYEKKKKLKEAKTNDGAVMRDGHPQICKYTKSCKYGSVHGCSYILATGESRARKGLFIRDGKCDAYKRGRKIHCELTVVSYPKEQHPHNFMEV